MELNFKTGKQGGYALVLILIALMAMGGVGVASYTQSMKQEAEHAKYLHNQRVLREAKQALLQYTYRYPQFNSQGPGRLPCPDTNNSGEPGDGGPLDTVACTSVGRFPWNEGEMNFYDARDADGERLWYAVSDNFYNLGGNKIINSDTLGTLSMRDRTGSLMHDASQDQSGTPHQGIAAVIIAPGSAIDRGGVLQDRSYDLGIDNPDDTVPDTEAGIVDPAQYLDLFANGIDNASFVNSTTDGFVLGPIEDTASGNLLVNDQIIIITAAEVIEMAEKAALEAYRDGVQTYLTATGGQYPWLYNYSGITYDTGAGEDVDDAVERLDTHFPANGNFTTEKNAYLDDHGRIPSIFNAYFAGAASNPVESELDLSFTIRIPENGVYDTEGEHFPFVTSETVVLQFRSHVLTDVHFDDLGDDNVDYGRLTVTSGSTVTYDSDIYFTQEHNNFTGPYTVCAEDNDSIPEVSDCHHDSGGTPDPGGSHDYDVAILQVIFEFEFTNGVKIFEFDYQTAPDIQIVPAHSDDHARISATFIPSDVINLSDLVSVRYNWDGHYHVGENYDPYYYYYDMFIDQMIVESVTVGMRYYPVLPRWIETNGWHNSVKMAYAEDYQPGGSQSCTPTYEMDTGCLRINWEPSAPLPLPATPGPGDWNMYGPNDIVSLLLIGREHGWIDGVDPLSGNPEKAPDGDLDRHDLVSIFDGGNENGNTTYFTRRGNDRVMVIE